jgi:pseudaminic acid cytidylyltransferase
MKLAVIPARGGSKRIPRKNVKAFCGVPMIARTIEMALQSTLFDLVVVSTEDDEIAAIARQAGALTPFTRPSELSDDLTPTVPVIAHAVRACNELGWAVQQTCCIYPCVPLLCLGDLALALEMLLTNEADFVYPVTSFAHPVQRAMRRLDTGQMQFLQPQYEMTRTQDLEKTFHDAGQFYWGQADAWLAHKKMHTAGLGLPIPNWRVVDIDNEDDWRRAELIYRAIAAEVP